MKPPLFSPTLASILLLAAASASRAESPTSRPSLFDPARHMHLADVRPGMKGYGLTVFHGTQIEKFDVEVVDIVKNFNTGFSAILINCPGPRSEHLCSVEGMSGSPVYLMAPDGTPRLIGAYAFGWDFAKDPLAGVQPIEYMLDLADPLVRRVGSNLPEGEKVGARARWTIRDLKLPEIGASGGVNLMMSGLSERTASQLAPLFQRYGVHPLLASGGGGGPASAPNSTPSATASATLEPGSSLIVPLVTGDADMNALGTCTEVIGDRVYGFGHPFFGDGGCELPMAAGYVNTVIASLKSSFKMGGVSEVVGVLRADTQVGIGGTFSGRARTIPVTIRIAYDDGSVDRTYHFNVARHPKLTPVLTAAAISAALNGVRDLPLQCTLDADVAMSFPGAGIADKSPHNLSLRNRLANPTPADLMMGVLAPLIATGDNPFARVYPDAITATFTVHPTPRTLELLSATTNRKSYHPGDTVTIDVACRPYHASIESRRIRLKLPKTLEPGDHPLVISEASRFLSDEQQSRPDKFSADSLSDIFASLAEQTSAPNNAIYVRLSSDPSGVAIGRVALPNLPPSRAQLLTTSATPDASPLIPSITETLKTEEVVNGEIELTITVEEQGKKHQPPQPKPNLPTQPARHGKLPGLQPDLGKLSGDEG